MFRFESTPQVRAGEGSQRMDSELGCMDPKKTTELIGLKHNSGASFLGQILGPPLSNCVALSK